MSERYRVLALMTSAQAGASVIQQGIGVLGPFFIAQFALTKIELGSLFFAMFLGSTLFTAVSGIMTDRLGERAMVLASGLLMAAALAAATIVPQYGWLLGCIFIFGVGYAAATPAGGRAILTWFDRDRGFAMGVRQTGVPIGGLIGGVLLPLLALHAGGYRAALLVAALLVALPSTIAFAFYRDAQTETEPTSLRELVRGMRALTHDARLWAVALVSMVLVSVQGAMIGFLAVTAIGVVGVSTSVASAAYASAFGAATVARLFWGWYSDRYLRGERLALLGAMSVLAGIAALGIAALRPALAGLMIPAAMFLGFSGAGWNGVMAAALAEIGGPARAGSALGLVLTAIFAASGTAPVIFGALADRTSLDTAWIATAMLAFCGIIPVLWLRARQPNLPARLAETPDRG